MVRLYGTPTFDGDDDELEMETDWIIGLSILIVAEAYKSRAADLDCVED
jgi:hypothetical protein